MDYKTFPYLKEVDDQHIQEETKYKPIMLLNIYIYIWRHCHTYLYLTAHWSCLVNSAHET